MVRFEYSLFDSFLLVSSIFIFLKWMLPRVPLADVLRQVRERLPQTGYLLCLFAALVASAIDYLETHFDACVTQAIQKDYTPFVSRFGTHWVEHVQRFRTMPLTYVLTYTYIWLLPAVMIALFLMLVFENNEAVAQFLIAGYFSNLLFVLPFYLFFPVNEVWASDSHVRLLTDRVSPLIMEHFRSISAVDNCFPSFHTSLALLVAIAGWKSRRRLAAALTMLSAVMVVASTLYLGIHWPFDILAGLVAAVFCASLSNNYAPQVFSRAALRFEQLREFAMGKLSI